MRCARTLSLTLFPTSLKEQKSVSKNPKNNLSPFKNNLSLLPAVTRPPPIPPHPPFPIFAGSEFAVTSSTHTHDRC